MVITFEIYKDIRRMRLGRMSQRQIAGALHISHNTVKKVLGWQQRPLGAQGLQQRGYRHYR